MPNPLFYPPATTLYQQSAYQPSRDQPSTYQPSMQPDDPRLTVTRWAAGPSGAVAERRSGGRVVLAVVGFGLAASVAIGVGAGLAVRHALAGVRASQAHVSQPTVQPAVQPVRRAVAPATPSPAAAPSVASGPSPRSSAEGPTVRMLTPRSGATVRSGTAVVLKARAVMADGSVVPGDYLRWTITTHDHTVVFRQLGTTVTVPAGRLPAGSYRVRAEVVVAGATGGAERTLVVR